MITFLNPNKKNLNQLIEAVSPLANDFSKSKKSKIKILENVSKICSWRENKDGSFLKLNPALNKNLKNLTKKLGNNKPTATKVMSSESVKTYIWLLKINGNTYIVYYNKNGLAIEGNELLPTKKLCKDLKELKSFLLTN